ncbi:hypothetical protein [Flocculibacter collagenilyticus]|uniref:hypothetical protein n=1 Tax=Flocculibacter collagenilyticus TaxID=2744479 RepID=UPI0018F54895|nr:hypothetical protein [Flocculibacter collagenilyticus]
MENFDPVKMLSLKLTTLTKRDQAWLLSQIPENNRKKITSFMKLVANLKGADKRTLAKHLQPDSKNISSQKGKAAALEVSQELKEHINFLNNNSHLVSNHALSIVTEIINGERGED